MNSFVNNISICGPAVAGKHHLLYQIGIQEGNIRPFVNLLKSDRYATLNLVHWNPAILLIAPTGAVLYREIMARFVLDASQCVVFVTPAREITEEDENSFNYYCEVAFTLKKSWLQIPWILVLNKVDLGNYNTLLERFPAELQSNVVRTNALTGLGVPKLIENIKEALSHQCK